MERTNAFIPMKDLALSKIDLNIEEVNLADVKGGAEAIYSGRGRNGRTGEMVNEWCIIIDDDNYEIAYS